VRSLKAWFKIGLFPMTRLTLIVFAFFIHKMGTSLVRCKSGLALYKVDEGKVKVVVMGLQRQCYVSLKCCLF